jgi:AsmA protein
MPYSGAKPQRIGAVERGVCKTQQAVSKIIAIPSDHANSVAPTPGGPARRVAARGPRSSQIPKSAPAARRTRLHAIAFYPLLGLVCLAVAVASFIALANPADVVRDRLAADAKTRLGRHLSVAGGASLTFLPFGVLLRDVELSAPDSPGSPLVRAVAVDVRVSLLSLLRQQVAVNALTITRPEINLSVDASGRSNWDFALARDTETRSVQLAQLAPRLGFGRDLPPDLLGGQGRSDAASKGPTPGAGRQGSETVIDVSVQDGLIRYSDTRSDVTKQITAVNLRVGLNGRARPANLSGDFIWAGEPVSLEVATDALDGTSARADIRLKSRMFDMAYSGRVSLTGATELDGRLTGRSRSIDTLARWLRGADPHPETGAERGAAVEGRLRVSGATLDLSDASIKVGGTSASGSISVDPSQRPPFIRADLKVAALDLDQAAPVSSGSAGQPSAAPRAEAHGARSIDDLLTRSDGKGTRPEGPGRRPPDQGYQASRPLDVSILQLANLDGRFEIGKLRWRGLDVGQAHVATTIAGGKLTANATEAHLYGGRAEGSLVIEPHGTQAAVNLNTTIDGVATQALLKDLLDFDWLDGRGQLVLMLSGEGASEKQIIDSLHGRAQIKVAEGALIGWDLTQMLRGLRQGTLPSTDRHPSARTRFGDLTGSFVIADGVARNEDLKVTGQSISVSGSGAVAYRDRSIDYTVRPRLSEAAGGLEDVEIPVRIHGTWEKPVLSPDLDSVLKDPRTAAKVQQLGRQLRSGNIDGALKGVLGDGPKAEKKAEKAKEFLKRFLKQ